MLSGFSGSGGGKRASVSSNAFTDEQYQLLGLNLVDPDQIMPPGESPMLLNTRRYASNDSESSVAQRTRKGSIEYSSPVGETADVKNVATSTGQLIVNPTTNQAIGFTPLTTGALTHATINLKSDVNTRGYLVVEVWTSSNSLPLAKIAQGSLAPNLIGQTASNVKLPFIDAPTLTAGTLYFFVLYMRDLGFGNYYLAQTAGSNGLTATNGNSWVKNNSSAQFATFLSTPGKFLGAVKRYPKTAPHTTVFAFNNGIYQMPDSPAVPTLIETYTNTAATAVRFTNVDEYTFWCDGYSPWHQWDGTTVTTVQNYPTTTGQPFLSIVYQNRLLFVPANDPTRIQFSALYDWTTWPNVNFFYIDRPDTPDWITAWAKFNNGLTVFTKRSKWSVVGSDITNLTPTSHAGTRGAISQEAIAVGKGVIYFMSDDFNIYAWNGVTDTLVSRTVWPEFTKVLDPTKVRLHLYKNQLRVYYNRNPDPEVQYMMLLDTLTGDWYKDIGRPVAGSIEWQFDTSQLMEFSSLAGWVFQGESGYSDLGKAIDWKYWTNYKTYMYRQRSGHTLGGAATKKNVKRFRPMVRPAAADYYLSVGKDVDLANNPIMNNWLVSSSGAKWGTFNWGDGTKYGNDTIVSNLAPMSGRGRLLQFRFEHDVIDDPVELFGYIAIIRVGRAQ